MFTRRLTVNIENLAGGGSFVFGGEWFETGGWKGERVTKIEEHCSLEFENNSGFSGVSGYAHYHNVDHSQTLVVIFSCPVSTAPCLTARAGAALVDCRALYDQVPDIVRPGQGLRRAEGCAWEAFDLQDEHVQVRLIVLPLAMPSAGDGVAADPRLSEELTRRLERARSCRSSLNEAPAANVESGALVERKLLVEVDNRSDEQFMFDGDWFENGRWSGSTPQRIIQPSNVTMLEFVSDTFTSGLSGTAWFVNEKTKDVYFSLCFANPLTGDGVFGAWAGPPPHELKDELLTAELLSKQTGVQVPEGRGCAWNIIERGTTIHVRLVILQEPSPIDMCAYPPRGCAVVSPALEEFLLDKHTSSSRARGGASGSEAGSGPSPAGFAAANALPPSPVDPAAAAGAESAANPGSAAAAEDRLSIQQDGDSGSYERFMNRTRPRDAFDGMGSGLKVAGGGIAAGAVAMVAIPIVGAREDGVSGFFSGLAKGVIGGVGLAVGGIAAGTSQVVRGALNTPEAISQATAGRRWDSENGKWVDDASNLRAEGDAAGNESDGQSSGDEGAGDGRPSRRVADTAFYDKIGVVPTASQGEIKRAYYKAALKVHPDKNPDDPEASQKFQALAQAYQVLSDPKLRERYDAMGQEAVNDAALPAIDPMLFFSMLFGSEQFEKYIGKLYLAMQTDHLAKNLQKDLERRQTADGEDADGMPGRDMIGESLEQEMRWTANSKRDRKMRRQQFCREVRCATQLCERLNRWVLGRDEAGWMASISQEAAELVRVSFGGRLLRTIGDAYEGAAMAWFATLRGNFTLETQTAQWMDSMKSTKTRINMMSSIASSFFAVKKMHDTVGQAANEDDQEVKEKVARQTMDSLEESLPVFLQTIWDVSVVDIENTLRAVCDKTLKDISVPWQIRQRRAVAMLRLGRIFRDVGQVEHSDVSQSSVAKRHLEEALYGSIRERGS